MRRVRIKLSSVDIDALINKIDCSKTPEESFDYIKEIPMVAIPLFLTGIVSIVMGLYPDYFVQLAKVVIGMPH